MILGEENTLTQAPAPLRPAGEIDIVRERVDVIERELETLRGRVGTLEAVTKHDSLTGVLTRDAVLARLQLEWNRHANARTELGLIFIDIDHFKEYNDRFDHGVGDEVLSSIGSRLLKTVRRAGEVVGRFGGDEFMIVVPSSSLIETCRLAEKVRKSLHAIDLTVGGTKLEITASLGVATGLPHADLGGAQVLMQRADSACLAAKSNGRDQCVAFQLSNGTQSFARVEPAS